MTIDWDFIGKREGAEILQGYVPKNKDGSVLESSGVTIATGFDLGQWSQGQIKSFGLSQALTRRLLPYCTKTKEVAVAYLKTHPLQVTLIEARAIDRAAKQYFTDKLRGEYDAESKVPFDSVPDEAQTVMMSGEFQWGTISAKHGVYWRQLVNQEWKQAEATLRAIKKYHKRRALEADLLAKMIKRQEQEEKERKARAAAQQGQTTSQE